MSIITKSVCVAALYRATSTCLTSIRVIIAAKISHNQYPLVSYLSRSTIVIAYPFGANTTEMSIVYDPTNLWRRSLNRIMGFAKILYFLL